MTIVQLGDYYYDDRHRIGSGSFSTIYKGYRTIDHLVVAIKKVHRVVNTQYFRNEVELMKTISHPNIVRLYEVLQQNTYVYMIMEYCNGGDLSRYIQRQTNKYDQRYFHQILIAFEYLHSKGIIHRDIKPPNVLIHQHNVKISDFGFAKSMESTEDLHSTFCGSPLYMSPEILKRQTYSMRSDLWSLGVLLYELVTKEHPYMVQNAQQLMSLVEQGHRIDYNTIRSKYYRDIVVQLLEPNETQRCSSDEFFRNLRKNDEFLEELDDLDGQKRFSTSELISSAIVPKVSSNTIPIPVSANENSSTQDIDITPRISNTGSLLRTPTMPMTILDTIRNSPNIQTSSKEITITSPNSKQQTTIEYRSFTPQNVSSSIPTQSQETRSRANSYDADNHDYLEHVSCSSSPIYMPCSAPNPIAPIMDHAIFDNYMDEKEKMSSTAFVMPVYGTSPTIKPKGISDILHKSVRSLSSVWGNFKL
jgi:serine/threonine protein kinase